MKNVMLVALMAILSLLVGLLANIVASLYTPSSTRETVFIIGVYGAKGRNCTVRAF